MKYIVKFLPIVLLSAVLYSCGGGTQAPVAAAAPPTPLETVRALAEINREFNKASVTDTGIYPSEIQRIRQRGRVIFAMTASDQKPFFYTDENSKELMGLDVELGYAIANRLGVTAVFNRDASSFDNVVMKVVNKEADIALSKLSRTMRRAELVRYTMPYIMFRQALLLNRLELAKVSSEQNLPDFIKRFHGRLGVIKNSSYISYAEINFPAADIQTYDSWDQVIDALFNGEVLGAYRDEGEILIINTLRKDASILMKPVFINDKQDPIAMAVAADAPLLQEWLNIFIEDYLLQNGKDLTPVRIVERHFGDSNLSL
jgi:ABC-type amino acid transport substrate-binding protein